MGPSSPGESVCLCMFECPDTHAVEPARGRAAAKLSPAFEAALQDAIYRERILVELQVPPRKFALGLSCALFALLIFGGRIALLRRTAPKVPMQTARISLALELPAEELLAPPLPPPAPRGGSSVRSPSAMSSQETTVQSEPTDTELPTTLPEAPVPLSTPGMVGGAQMGVPGGMFGGAVGGKLGGALEGQGGMPVIPPRADAAYLKNPQPIYPMACRRAGENGTVKLRVLVGASGRVLELEIKQSSGFSQLDSAALEAVRKWSFIPAKRGEASVEAWVTVPITFSLN